MIQRTTRPLTEMEQNRLRRQISALGKQKKIGLKWHLTASLIVFGSLWVATLLASDDPWWVITLFWLVVGGGISSQILYSEHRKRLRLTASIQDALSRNLIDETRISANLMVELEEIEDLGACYAFQAEEDKIIFVRGQEFYPSKNFPNTDFSILEIQNEAGKTIDFRIEKRGMKLRPIRVISVQRQKSLRFPAHLEVLDGSLDNLEDLLWNR